MRISETSTTFEAYFPQKPSAFGKCVTHYLSKALFINIIETNSSNIFISDTFCLPFILILYKRHVFTYDDYMITKIPKQDFASVVFILCISLKRVRNSPFHDLNVEFISKLHEVHLPQSCC